MSCSNCGNPICPDCMTTTSVGMRCPDCANQKTKVRTVRSMTDEPTLTYVLIAVNVIVALGSLFGGGGATGGATRWSTTAACRGSTSSRASTGG